MRMPPLKLRRHLIVVAALAPPLVLVVSCIKNDAYEEEFYEPGGVLQRAPEIWAEVMAGRDALGLHRLAEAEARFRSALADIDRNFGPIPVDMRRTFFRERFGALAGLADTLAVQGQFAEAMPVYGAALSSYREGLRIVAPEFKMSDDPEVAKLLERRAACLREIEGRAISTK